MTLDDLRELYALACSAPLARADMSQAVASLFARVEAEITKSGVRQTLEFAKAHLEQTEKEAQDESAA